MSELPVILVAEDEYLLHGIIEESLAEGGFASDILTSGEEALTVLRGRGKNYKALITDVNLMGRLSGWQVARRVREKEPSFPVIYMTGAAAHEWATHGVLNSVLVEKPFAATQLVTALTNLLNIASLPLP